MIRKGLTPDAFSLVEQRGDLEQGERVPAGRLHEVAGDLRFDRRAEPIVKELQGRRHL